MKNALTSARDIERLFAEGAAARSQFLTVVARAVGREADPDGHVMIIAGRRMGTAVQRNRAKRVLRETVRRAGGPWAGFHVAVIARPTVLRARQAEVDADLAEALVRAGVVR